MRLCIFTCEDIYERRVSLDALGHSIAIVGGSGVSLETGLYLASQGKTVTLLSRQKVPAKDLAYAHNNVYYSVVKIDPVCGYGAALPVWERYEDYHVIVEAQTKQVGRDFVRYVDKDGQTIDLRCDSVIVSGGYRRCQEEAYTYLGCAPEFYLAGDADDQGGDIQKGNVSAFGKVQLL